MKTISATDIVLEAATNDQIDGLRQAASGPRDEWTREFHRALGFRSALAASLDPASQAYLRLDVALMEITWVGPDSGVA